MTLFIVLSFLLGLCIGSFLNVVIYRLEKGESIVMGRSHCFHCHHTLGVFDLIPLLSFIFLRGRCRYCHKRISIQYPLVELVTGIVFASTFNLFAANSQTLALAVGWYIAASLIVIFVYDLKYYLIPDVVLLPAIIVAFLARLTMPASVGNYVGAALVMAAFFLIIHILSSGRAMGFGDVKLAVLLGLILGFKEMLLALFLSFLFGAIIGIILIFLKKKGLKSEVPFGPFLIAGTSIAWLWGSPIIAWYSQFLIF